MSYQFIFLQPFSTGLGEGRASPTYDSSVRSRYKKGNRHFCKAINSWIEHGNVRVLLASRVSLWMGILIHEWVCSIDGCLASFLSFLSFFFPPRMTSSLFMAYATVLYVWLPSIQLVILFRVVLLQRHIKYLWFCSHWRPISNHFVG